ncbi:MAG: hypothetical protein IJE08_11055 [Clostridia bacterium]|nr:hypothetical protein [Clostridia bacterium]
MRGKLYRGDFRREISFPVGGIGAGCIGLDGYGRLRDWEIFNRPNKQSLNGYSHFAVRAEKDGKVIDARIMNADLPPTYMGEALAAPANFGNQDGHSLRSNYGFGPGRALLTGMPHFRDCAFEGAFPFAKVTFEDAAFPGEVSLSAFNPFIPQDEDASSMPAGFYTVTITNTQDSEIEYTAALSLGNPYGGTHDTELIQNNTLTAVQMIDLDVADVDDPAFSRLLMAVEAGEEVSVQQNWFRGSWFDDLSMYWHDFTTPGPLKSRVYEPRADWKGRMDTSTLAVHAKLRPGETRAIRFVIAWYMPTCVNYWKPVREEEGIQGSWKTFYVSMFGSAQEVAECALKRWDELLKRTEQFADALYGSDLPESALDAVCANIAVLKSPTCLRLTNGEFYGWEGCRMTEGSCEGSCTHVWNYAFALPFLFPRLERSMRELDFTYNQRDDGGMAFRLQLPLGRTRSTFPPCVDGEMGGVIKSYREWKIMGDDEWLKTWWPKIKKSLEFAWSDHNEHKWDPGKTGVITGRQHHTLDMELFGPNAWLNTFYLAALKAAAEMAERVGDSDSETYRELYKKGREFTERELFNGEYFIQRIDLNDEHVLDPYEGGSMVGSARDSYWNEETQELKYQIGEGCGIDQVLAQWMSDMSGLGEVLDGEKVASALQAIYKHNFYPELRAHANPCRIYGLNDEAGTVICEWPDYVRKPIVPVPYAEETMHGFEYQAATHLIARGFEKEGLEMVKAVRDRYDGYRRNPWNEMECGSNYARSMASFALMLIYSGIRYDMPDKKMGFMPLKGTGKFFWSLEGAWGTVEIDKDRARLTVVEGEIGLKEFVTAVDVKEAEIDGEAVSFTKTADGVRFEQEAVIGVGGSLYVGA